MQRKGKALDGKAKFFNFFKKILAYQINLQYLLYAVIQTNQRRQNVQSL